MKISTTPEGLILETIGAAETQVLINALHMYAENYMGSNAKHLDIAIEMDNMATDEYIKDVVLTEEEKKVAGL